FPPRLGAASVGGLFLKFDLHFHRLLQNARSEASCKATRFCKSGRLDMPDYFVFWDEIVGRIRIHRADCEVCKYGKGMHEGRINEGRASTSDWEPADTYAKAC